jgi:hypothetical protein
MTEIRNSATMYAHTNYYHLLSGAVGKSGIPDRIRIGDKITVGDRSLTVRAVPSRLLKSRLDAPVSASLAVSMAGDKAKAVLIEAAVS